MSNVQACKGGGKGSLHAHPWRRLGLAVRSLVSRPRRTYQSTILTCDSQDPLLKYMADNTGLAVLSIGYRLAPEDPFPAGPEDCYDAAEYLIKNGKERFGGELMFMGGEVRLLPFSTLFTGSP